MICIASKRGSLCHSTDICHQLLFHKISILLFLHPQLSLSVLTLGLLSTTFLLLILTAAGLPKQVIPPGASCGLDDPIVTQSHSDEGGAVAEAEQDGVVCVTEERDALDGGVGRED